MMGRLGNGLPRFSADRIDLWGDRRGFDTFGSVVSTRMLGRGWEGGRGVASGVGTGLRHGHEGSEVA